MQKAPSLKEGAFSFGEICSAEMIKVKKRSAEESVIHIHALHNKYPFFS